MQERWLTIWKSLKNEKAEKNLTVKMQNAYFKR
jgi:hypothetical protein